MKYEPKTLPVQREGVTKFFAATKSGGAQWWTDEVSAAVVADLAHCEACLAEAELENQKLRECLRELIEVGNAAIKGDYSDWDSVVPKAEALLNSEGRAVT